MTSPDQAPELMPCPFCGAAATVEEIGNAVGHTGSVCFSVGCNSYDEDSCMGYQSFQTFARRSDAIKAWNTRSSPPAGGETPTVDEIAAQIHEGRFSEGRAQVNYNMFADEDSSGQQYCRRIARKLLETFRIHPIASESVSETEKAILELCSRHGFATGHGDTLADIIREIDGQLSEREQVR